MGTAITLLIGCFIGWNLPQPQWAKALQSKLLSAISNLRK